MHHLPGRSSIPTCPDYGCIIYEPFYLNYREIDSCDLDGKIGNNSFILQNFANTPLPPECTDIHQFDIGKGYDEYYRVTSEFSQCENKSYAAAELCNDYVIPCSPVEDEECGNWMIDDNYVKNSPQSTACRDNAHQQLRACHTYLEKVDPSTMVMWKDRNGRELPAMRSCELHFSIPSDNESGQAYVPPMQVAHIEMEKDTGSIWCRVMNLLGMEC
ncbi:MAG: hypothetical protein M0Q92_06965 [Methanoregula sp.]|jgi:hypothetical protein|nr:hypothetical protein [Methanoregula sp.]